MSTTLNMQGCSEDCLALDSSAMILIGRQVRVYAKHYIVGLRSGFLRSEQELAM